MIGVWLALCLLGAPVNTQISNLDMWGLINVLYIRSDSNMDMTVTEEEFGRIYSSMDANNDTKVTWPEFHVVWQSITQYSDEHVHAYFRLADTDRNLEVDKADNDRIYQIFDEDGDGTVSAKEFSDEWQEVFHRVPFVILFERTDKNNDSKLTLTEMMDMFSSFTTEADGSITKANLLKGWESNRFGTSDDATHVFASVDADGDGSVTRAELGGRFKAVDKNGDGAVDISEVELMGDAVPIV